MTAPFVTLETDIEELVQSFPEAVGFLTQNGVRCVRCGQPVWGSLGRLLEEDGIQKPEELVEKLNEYLKDRKC